MTIWNWYKRSLIGCLILVAHWGHGQTINQAEYFVDSDPGVGNGTAISVATAATLDQQISIDVSGLAIGDHILYLRTKEAGDRWSIAKTISFYLQDTARVFGQKEPRVLVAAEYFVDEDLGTGKGMKLPLSVLSQTESGFSFNTAGLAFGEHKLYVRTKNNTGVWSISSSVDFAVLPTDRMIPIPRFKTDTVSAGESTTFTNLSDSVDENTTYKWDIFDDGVVDFSETEITYTFDTTGLLPVRLWAFNGEDSASFLGKVAVGNFENTSITASGSLELCEGEEVTLTAPEGFSIYAWNTGDSTQSITVSDQGIYYAWLSDENGLTIQARSVTVDVTPQFEISVKVQDASNTMNNGYAEVFLAPSFKPQPDVLWSNGATSNHIKNLAAGNYSVTVTSGSCSETVDFTVGTRTVEVTGTTPTAIIAAEYFIDTDPGVGNGSSLSVSQGEEVEFQTDIPTDGLEVGDHWVYVRTLANNGIWSEARSMSFYVQDPDPEVPLSPAQNIVAAEYYIDDDPGFGNGTSIAGTNPTKMLSGNLSVSTTALDNGDHKLYLRTQSDLGNWSQSQSLDFQVCDLLPPVPTASDLVACPGESVTVQVTGTAGTFAWFDGDTIRVEGESSASLAMGTIAQDTTIYVGQVDGSGCQSELAEIKITAPELGLFAGLDLEVSQIGTDYQLESFYPQEGVWSGSLVSSDGLIDRSSLSTGSYTLTYSSDKDGCTFSDARVVEVLDFSQTYDWTVAENPQESELLETLDLEGVQSFSIVNGDANAISIDNMGNVWVADSTIFDYETNASPSWEIHAEISKEITYQIILDITLTDEPDRPVIEDQEFSINENSANGTVIGTIVASDQDSPSLAFSITSGNESGTFEINTSNELVVLDSTLLDFETQTSFSLEVTASDGDLISSAFVTILVNDVDENTAPVIENQTFTVDENIAAGELVGVTAAEDDEGDALTFAILSGNDLGGFALSTSGELTVSDSTVLDYETNASFSLEIEVSDGELTASATITINLNDIEESANESPEIVDQTFSIDENSAEGSIIGTVTASDPDGDALTFAILSGNDLAGFALSTSGEMTVADSTVLDFETNASFSLEIEVSDGELTVSATITINLNDIEESVNESPEIVDQTFSIDENSAEGSIIGAVAASDPDGNALTFAILSGNADGGFAIDINSGELTVADASVLDFETNPSFSLEVEVSDGTLTTTAMITINLNDVDESTNQAPEISDQVFQIDENSENGTEVGTVQALDPDGDLISFNITSRNDNGAFALSATTGVLVVSDQSALDFELNPFFTIVVQVSDGELTAEATITISLTDLDENALASEKLNTLNVYPNPVSDRIYVDVLGFDSLRLLDLSGKEVGRSFVPELDVTEMERGVYLLEIIAQERRIIRKVILHK